MRMIIVFILFLLLPACLMGQDISSGLKIDTNPPGASVTLYGDISINGLSPISFPGELKGKFKLVIKEEGYHTYRQTLNIYPGLPQELTYSLTQKTKFQAAWRSLIIPGWGQMYSGREGKGVIFTLLAAGAAGYYFIADKKFYDKLDDYSLIKSKYNSATNEAEKNSLYSLLRIAKRRAYDAESDRLNAIGGVIGVWAVNLIDALIFFPKVKGKVAVNSLTLKPDANQGGAQIVFSHRF